VYTQADWLRDELAFDKPDFCVDEISSSVHSVSNINDALIDFKNNGIAIFKNVINKDLIKIFNHEIDYLKNNYKQFELKAEYRGVQLDLKRMTPEQVKSSGTKFNSIHTLSKTAQKISLNKKLVEFLTAYFGSAPAILQSLTFVKGSQQPPHLDYPYVKTQKRIPVLGASWIALEDISEDAGALEYYLGSHKICRNKLFDWGKGSILFEEGSKFTPMEFSRYLESLMEENKIKKSTYCPRVGDLLIWHPLLVHGGGEIKNDSLTRKSYVTHYTSLESYPDRFGLDLGKLDMCNLNGGYCFEYPWLDKNRLMLS
jgi:phytanoyl-CoA hydroxylase